MSSLLRSTKFMRYFTAAARTLILNSDRSAGSNPLIDSKVLLAANNVFTSGYATTKKTESVEPLLEKLDSEVRMFGRIANSNTGEIFDKIRENDITSSQSLKVIRYCGDLLAEELPEQRTLLVQKIWSVLTERGVPMDISHYNALLRVYLENEHPFSPAQFLEELEKKGLKPNRVTYSRLMWRYCQEGDLDCAKKVLEKMRESNIAVSEPVFNVLIMGHAFHGDTDGAKAVLETMTGAGLQPSNLTYSWLACGYARQGDVNEVDNIIKTASEKEAFMTNKDIFDIIEQMALGGHGDKVEQLFHHLQKGVSFNKDACNSILRLINKGHEGVAKAVLSIMSDNTNAEKTIFKGGFFVKQLIKLNKPANLIIKTCRELRNENLIPGAIYMATEKALQHGKVELAQGLFKELEKDGHEIRQHYYWPLIVQKGREGDEEGVLQIIRNSMSHGLMPNGETLREYVFQYLIKKGSEETIITKLQIAGVPAVHTARNLIVDLLDRGNISKAASMALIYRPKGQFAHLARSLLNAVDKTKDVNSFVSILHVISSQQQREEDSQNEEAHSDSADTNEVGRIVNIAIKFLDKPEYAEQILKALQAKGIRISAEHAEEIQQYLGQNMTSNLSELLASLTSADLELIPLENIKRPQIMRTSTQLYAQLKSRGSNSNRVQKQLLQAYMSENQSEKLEDLLEEIKGTDFEMTPGTLAQLFEFYSINGDVRKAKQIHDDLMAKYPEFALVKLKIINYALALVKADKFDEAIQFLKDNKFDGEEEDNSYNYKCWQLLNHLAELKDDDKVKQMTETMIETNYIAPSNVILGPSIKVHLLKNDVDGALKEFENCCNKYRSTPYKGELMKALILKEDATKLQRAADLSTQIHGEINILHDLVIAFVECGRHRQARRILETPGMYLRQRRFEGACQRYAQEGKSEYLEGLLKATKELSHIDRSNIFYHLLVTYCKADDTDKALGVWTVLQEEGEVPSEQFLSYLGQHLKSKNRPVPFVMPDTPKVTENQKPKQEKSAQKKSKNRPVPFVMPDTPKVTENQKPKQEKSARKKHEIMLATIKDISEKVEAEIHSGDLKKAMDMTLESIENGIIPLSRVVKFLIRNLAQNGDSETIMKLEGKITDYMKSKITYNDTLTLALFNKGHADTHLDALLKDIEAENSNKYIEKPSLRFPRSIAIAVLMDNEPLIHKCQTIAEVAASKGFTLPANLLWQEYVLAGKDKEADNLFKMCLKNAPRILYMKLLKQSIVRKEPQILEKLITALKSNEEIPQGDLGNVFTSLIQLHLENNNTQEALSSLDRATKIGIDKKHVNEKCLKRLEAAVEAEGKNFDYSF